MLMQRLKLFIYNLLLWFDCGLNMLCGGSPFETCSSRLGRHYETSEPARALADLLDWAAFTPSGSSHQLLPTATDNTIKDVDLVTEPHILTVTWVFGTGDRTGTEECRYDVKNLLHA